jgi:hypothetical protein
MAERIDTPADEALLEALNTLRAAHASLGITKLHAALLDAHPTWLVSEKRTRKALQAGGLMLAPPASADAADAPTNGDASVTSAKKKPKKKSSTGAGGETRRLYPASRPTRGLDVAAFSPKIAVHDFGGGKGKGLVATAPIAAGELLWKEDPWIVQAEWCASAHPHRRRRR